MNLLEEFSEKEIEMILNALEFQSKKWIGIYRRPLQGYGTATEIDNKKDAKSKAEEYRTLASKVAEMTI